MAAQHLKFCIVFVATFAAFLSPAAAQEVKVGVSVDGSPLPKAPVYINSSYFAPTDDDGTLLIPVSKLSPSDTLSSSIPGLHASKEIYDASRNDYEIRLTSDIRIQDVVVSGKSRFNPKRFFKKYIKIRRTYFDFAVYIYDFIMSDGVNTPLTGQFTYSELPDYYVKYTGETGIRTNVDWVGESVPRPEYDPVLSAVHRAAVISIPSYEDAIDRNFLQADDISTREGRRLFSFNVEGGGESGRRLVSTVEADSLSGEILASKCELRDTADISIEAQTAYAYDKEYDLLHPALVKATYSGHAPGADTLKYDIVLESTRVKRYPRTMMHVEYKRSTFKISSSEKKHSTMLRNWTRNNPSKATKY